jgi:hypothetical protein
MKFRKELFLLLMFFVPAIIGVTGCGDKSSVSEVLLTDQEKQNEKKRIIELINTYNQGANERNWQKMVSTLANEIMFFGTDSGEVSSNFNEFKNTIQGQ